MKFIIALFLVAALAVVCISAQQNIPEQGQQVRRGAPLEAQGAEGSNKQKRGLYGGFGYGYPGFGYGGFGYPGYGYGLGYGGLYGGYGYGGFGGFGGFYWAYD